MHSIATGGYSIPPSRWNRYATCILLIKLKSHMIQDKGFHAYVMSYLLGHLIGIRSRAMFGGWGLYKDGIIFGMIDVIIFTKGASL